MADEVDDYFGFWSMLLLCILFIPYIIADLFVVATETTEYERRCNRG